MILSRIKTTTKLIIVLSLLLVTFGIQTLKAEDDKTLRQYGEEGHGGEVASSSVVEFGFDRSNNETNLTRINEYSEYESIQNIPAGSSGYVLYKEALDFYGNILDVRLDFDVISGEGIIGFMENDETYGYKQQVLVGNVNKSKTIDVTVSFFKDGKPYKYTGLYGLGDPDFSNYIFDTKNRDIFYIDADRFGEDKTLKMADYFLVKQDGLYPVDQEFKSDYNEGVILVQLNAEESFTMTLDIHGDWLIFPYLYRFDQEYNIIYKLNGGTNDPKNPSKYRTGNEIGILEPSRDGFVFLGWEEGDVINPWDYGDKTFTANWKAIDYKLEYKQNEEYVNKTEKYHKVDNNMNDKVVNVGTVNLDKNLYTSPGYKFVEWNTKPDGSGVSATDLYEITGEMVAPYKENDTVVTLYAQWEPITYTVKYDANGGTGNMSDQTPLSYDADYNLNQNAFTREGYTWMGWNTSADKSGQDFTDKQGFKNLIETDGGVVTMYAQWEPWKYHINYDANGGTGTMDPQTFLFTNETMESKENAFTRGGHRFTGFKYEYNGNVRIIRSPQDFKALLLELGPNSTITLVAQWEYLPKGYVAPVTGVE